LSGGQEGRLSELFCAVLCTTVAPSYLHAYSYEQFLQVRGLLWLLTPMKRASTHPLVDLWARGGHVIAGLLEPVGDSSEGLFLALSHGIQPSESAGHVLNVCQHRLIVAPCSCQRSTLA